MKTEDKYYRKLVEGYLNKTLTKRELAVFFDLLSKGELDFYLEEDMVSSFAEEPVPARPRFSWRKSTQWAVTASLLIAIGLSIYFVQDWDTEPQDLVSTAHTIKPGGDHAILTLSNGEQIILDSSGQTEEITDDRVSVVNDNKGSLHYDLSKLELSGIAPEELTDRYHTIETPRGGTYHIILSDGSKVWLNSLSKIRFPLVFLRQERVVEMEGEVFFDVAENKTKPFMVHSKGQAIKVLGTSFNINAYDDEPFTRTTLFTGQIELTAANSTIQLRPGEEALNTDTNLKIQIADVEQTIAWKDGYFRFDKVDILTLMRQISRWYNVNVKYEGNVSDERFVGKIKRSGDIDELLKIFNDGGMNVSLNGRTVVVKN